MDEIQLMTQPEKEQNSSTQEETLQKLKDLVSNSQAEEEEEKGKEDKKEADSKKKDVLNHKYSPKDKKDNNDNSDASGSEMNKSEDNVEYDHDGFEIPPGKIPLDGHFSTSEIKKLVELSKEEGILKEDVHLEVLESNEVIGDRVVLTESDRTHDDCEEQDKNKECEGDLDEGKLKDKEEQKNKEEKLGAEK